MTKISQMIAPLLFLFVALLLPAAISRAADSTNSPPATSQESAENIEGSPEWVRKMFEQSNSDAVINLGTKYATGDGVARNA
jgi:TPR repeat protein